MSKWCDGVAGTHLNRQGIVNLIKEVETIVTQYFSFTPSIKVLNNNVLKLLRCYSYNNLYWDTVAGIVSPDMVKFAEKTNPTIMAKIKSFIHMNTINAKEVDFPHLCAAIDGYFNSVTKEWAGWMGDVATFAQFLAERTEHSTNYDYVVQTAISTLGSNDCRMSFLDIHADVDAENLYNNYLKDNKIKLSDAFNSYYIKTNQAEYTYNVFITNMDPSYDAPAAWDKLCIGPDPNIYVFLGKMGYGTVPNQIARAAAYGTFANYVFLNRDKPI